MDAVSTLGASRQLTSHLDRRCSPLKCVYSWFSQVCNGNTGHAEVVQLRFDPSLVSFEDILKVRSQQL